MRATILGSTGSVGRQTLEALDLCGVEFEAVALTGYSNAALLAEQALALRPQVAAIGDPALGEELARRLEGSGIEAASGRAAVVEAAGRDSDLCVAAIVGMEGLEPTVAALDSCRTLALANKECLVAAGGLFMARAAKAGVHVVPLDSEHAAISELLRAHGRERLLRVVITASGGPFRDWSMEDMADVTFEEATRHPKWDMGDRISVASASMFNKAAEIIEAHHLFDLDSRQIEILVHPQCLVHGLAEYAGGQIYAQLAPTSMAAVVANAMNWRFAEDGLPRLPLAGLARLDFESPDVARFPAIRQARHVLAAGGAAGCVFNAAHECALEAFIAGRLGFLDMAAVVEEAMERFPATASFASFEEVCETARSVHRLASDLAAARLASI